MHFLIYGTKCLEGGAGFSYDKLFLRRNVKKRECDIRSKERSKMIRPFFLVVAMIKREERYFTRLKNHNHIN